MAFENRHYVTFAVTELNQIDFDQVLETSAETVRLSIDGTETFVKYEGDMPATVAALSTKSEPYTHDEILAILNTAEWSAPISEV
jgi:hypothetical protein